VKRSNYSVGSAQRIRETLQTNIGCGTYKAMGLNNWLAPSKNTEISS
jgi:hypothetical protein